MEYICPHCDKPIYDDEALLCLYCGENLERGVGTLGKMRYSTHWTVVAVVVAIVIGIFVFFVLGCAPAGAKQADLAGKWYSDSGEELAQELNGYLKDAEGDQVEGDLIGVVAPHAAFRFSGPIAAYAYKAIKQKAPDTIVIVGFTHRRYFPNRIAVFTDEAFYTPLGKARIDLDITKRLLAYDVNIRDIPEAFDAENSVEMQVPFAQIAAKDARLVLIALCDQRSDNQKLLAEALYSVLGVEKNLVVVASTDMSHYLAYDEANKKDEGTIDEIKKFNARALYRESLENKHELMCGYGAVCAVMAVSKALGADDVEILKCANSGDTFGDKKKVVGYLSAAFVKKEGDMLTDKQRQELLTIARDTIKHYLKTGETLEVETSDEVLKRDMGAFVTLHKQGRLRGCIGNMVARGPLYLAVRDMAIAAAVEDPRFPEVTAEELDDIDIEISALSPMEKIDDHNLIEVGKHGVMVQMGFRSGVYLPQVAEETGWTKDEFMNSLCGQKAGIREDAWKTGECEIFIFTAEVFGEKERNE